MIKNIKSWNLEFKKLQKTIYTDDINVTIRRIQILHEMTHQKEVSNFDVTRNI